MLEEKPSVAATIRLRFGWALAAVIALVVMIAGQGKAEALAALKFRDRDDELRLVQVRDWMAGQSWFDVSQHRLNWTDGGGMHWSRLVDVPIAMVIRLAGLFVEPAQAERVALVVVPLATLAIALTLLGLLVRRLAGELRALAAVALVTGTITVIRQFEPMRIDHHGWQAVAALAIVLALVERAGRRGTSRGAALAGAASATWLAISIEGLPFVAAAAALLGLRYMIHDEIASLRAFAMALATGCVLLLASAGNLTVASAPFCDALSLAYLPSIAVFALGAAAVAQLRTATRKGRLLNISVVALAALAVLPLAASTCVAGPFGNLDPLVRELWYLRVHEGLPAWRQPPVIATVTVLTPLLGLLGMLVGWRDADAAGRRNWVTAATLLAASLVIAVLLQRFEAVAKLLALPGLVVLAHAVWRRGPSLPSLPGRMLAKVVAVAVALPTPALVLAWNAVAPEAKRSSVRERCTRPAGFAALDRLPPGAKILAPLDIGPQILVYSHARVLATGHHRNAAAMTDVVTTFVGDAATVQAVVARHRPDYLVVCPSMREMRRYRRVAPHGLAADLLADRPPAWLEPVPLTGSHLRVWRVR